MVGTSITTVMHRSAAGICRHNNEPNESDTEMSHEGRL